MKKQSAFFDPAEFGLKEEPQKIGKRNPPKRRLIKPQLFTLSEEERYKLEQPANCKSCGLYKNCNSPKMKPSGEGLKGILIVGEAPGKVEDEKGKQFVGESGEVLFRAFRKNGINIYRDAKLDNTIACRPPDNIYPNQKRVKYCKPRLVHNIRKIKPKLIFAVGEKAIKGILDDAEFEITAGKMRGRIVPSLKYNCWVCCLFHSACILRRPEHTKLFERDIREGLMYLKKPFKKIGINEDEGNVIIYKDFKRAVKILKAFQKKKHFCFDYETTGVNTHTEDFKILMFGIGSKTEKAYSIALEHPQAKWTENQKKILYEEMKKLLIDEKIEKTIHNLKYEDLCSKRVFNVFIRGKVYDTMVNSHIIDERKGTTSLAFQIYVRTGSSQWKSEVEQGNLIEEDIKDIGKYNCIDVRNTLWLRKEQEKEIKKQEYENDFKRASLFLTETTRAFARMEKEGVQIDVERLKEISEKLQSNIEMYQRKIAKSKPVKLFTKKYKKNFNYNSNPDLSFLYYDLYGMKPIKEKSSAGNYSVDAECLKKMLRKTKDENLKKLTNRILAIRKLEKLEGTYLKNWFEKLDNRNRIHPSFMNHTVETYRSSSARPNFQNIPEREQEAKKIKQLIVPRYDCLLKCDYSGSEVCVIAMYSKDKKLIEYLLEGYDFHREWASRIFRIPIRQVTKQQRYDAKNGWVFAMFYGSYWENRAKYPAFSKVDPYHLQNLEKELWQEHKGIKNWQNEQIAFYKRNLYVKTFFGFRRRAPLSINQIINTPIQATSYHLLQNGINNVIKDLKKEKMKSKAIIQVHDELVLDVKDSELEKVMGISNKRLTKKRFYWEIVPMKMKWYKGKNLFDMEEIKI